MLIKGGLPVKFSLFLPIGNVLLEGVVLDQVLLDGLGILGECEGRDCFGEAEVTWGQGDN